MLKKTFTTFHALDMLLQQQYPKHWFTKYSELISCFLVAKQNNKLLMRNHRSCPTGSKPFPEVNEILSQTRGQGHGHERNPWYHGSYGNNSSNS